MGEAAAGPANVRVTPLDGRDYQQPSLAADPTRSGRLALAYQDGRPHVVCGLALSDDGGDTWRSGAIAGAGGGAIPEGFAACWNPSVAFGPDGTLYFLVQTSLLPSDPYSHVLLATSHDGGRSFGPLRNVDPSTPAFAPGARAGGDWWPRMAVDPRRATLHVVWSRFTPDLDSSQILITSSADRGVTFSPPVRVSEDQQLDVTGPEASVGPGGELDLAWFDYTEWERGNTDLARCGLMGCSGYGFTGAQMLALVRDLYHDEGTRLDFTQGLGCEAFVTPSDTLGRGPDRGGMCQLPGLVRTAVSTDGGRSFRAGTPAGGGVDLGCFVANAGIQTPPPAPGHVCDATHYSNYDHNLESLVSGRSAGELLVGWWDAGRSDSPGPARIALSLSSDAARSWAGVPLPIPGGADSHEQHRPRLSISPGGRLDVAYYDLSPAGAQDVLLVSADHPGGAFSDPVRVDDASSNASRGPDEDDNRPGFGDRLAVVSMPDGALVAWTDTRSGLDHQEVYVARVPAPITTPGPSPATARQGASGAPRAIGIGAGVAAFAGVLVAAAMLRRRVRHGPGPGRVS